MIKYILLSLISLSSFGQLSVSTNGRFLKTEKGEPFFWLGDTAWELFHALNQEETLFYLDKRASQGFNVVQAVALAELDGLHTPNAFGAKPLLSVQPLQLNPDYFQHVGWVIDQAAQRGIYIALLPTWGDKVFTHSWGTGPEIFNTGNAKDFGFEMGKLFKSKKNLVWVLGGDRNPRKNSEDTEIWNLMADGIKSSGARQLMTFHPQPASPGGSSNWFHGEKWLDFNMHQTGHCPDQITYLKIQHDYQLSPYKPVIDGEPLYEDHPNCFNAKEKGYSIPEDIRRMIYWNVFAGAFGQTYGCHAVWQMYKSGNKGVNGPLRPWHVALDLPMANQMKHLKNLLLSRDFFSRIPDSKMILTSQAEDTSFVIATRDSNGKYAMVYFPSYKEVTLDLQNLNFKRLKGYWFDPRTGNSTQAFEVKSTPKLKISPPVKDGDWVLVLDAASAGYPKPGDFLER